MKEQIKKILVTCMLMLSVLGLSACSASSSDENVLTEEERMMVDQGAQMMFEQFLGVPDDQLDELIEINEENQNTVLASGLNSWKSAKKDLGEFVSVDAVETEKKADGSYVTVLTASFAERQCDFTIGLNKRQTEYTEMTFSPQYSMTELLGQAAGNLVVGMGTVFAILIFIAWIISLLKYVNRFTEKKDAKKEAPKAAPAPAAAPAVTVTPVSVNKASEDEIQAVIAAAIAAYEAENNFANAPVCANGITVRSFRRTANASKRR